MFEIVREIYRSIANRFHLAILVIVSVAAAATGPFGSFQDHSFGVRLAYWTIVTAASIVSGRTGAVVSRHLVSNKRPVLQDVLFVSMMLVFFAPPLWFFTTTLAVENPSVEPSLIRMTYYVACIATCVCILKRIFPKAERPDISKESKLSAQQEPRLVRRLSSNFKGPILRLSGRDHFVDVISETTNEAIRMRFSDAIEEMDTVSGYVTHRSHWVAAHAVINVQRNKGKIHLVLVNGDEVPVSRKYKTDLENAGVIYS